MESYRIHQLTAEGNTTGVQTVDGALDSFVMAELEPETDYCFQLEAVRGGQSSPLSGQQCARTGLTPPPTDASGTAVSSESAASSAVSTPPALSSAVVSVPDSTDRGHPTDWCQRGRPGRARRLGRIERAGHERCRRAGDRQQRCAADHGRGSRCPRHVHAEPVHRRGVRRPRRGCAGAAARGGPPTAARAGGDRRLRAAHQRVPEPAVRPEHAAAQRTPTSFMSGPFENSPSLTQFCQAQATLLAPCLPVRPNPVADRARPECGGSRGGSSRPRPLE